MRCQQIEASGYATAMLADHAKEGMHSLLLPWPCVEMLTMPVLDSSRVAGTVLLPALVAVTCKSMHVL